MNKELSIKKKIVYILGLSAIFGILVSFIVYNIFNYGAKQKIYDDIKTELLSDIDKNIKDKKLVLLSSAIALSTNIEVINALKTNKREPLIWLFRKNHRMLQNSTSYKNVKFHIHTKDGYSFFRNWKAHTYGDDLKSYRHSVNQVINTKKAVVTIEKGKFGLFINAIVPIFDNEENYLGSLEAKGKFDSIATTFKMQNKNFIALMDKKFLKKQKTGLIYIDNYMLVHNKIDKNFIKKVEKLDFKLLLSSSYIEDDENLYFYKDIKDFSGNKVGIYLISESKNRVENMIAQNNKLAYMLLGIIVAIFALIGTLMTTLLKKHIIEPLNLLENGLLDFFKYLSGDKKEIHHIKINANDEIGVMSQVINKNILKLNSELQKDENMINDLITCVQKVEDGRLDCRISQEPSKNELQKVKLFFNKMIETLEENIGSDINSILESLKSYQEQDYNKKIIEPTGKIEKSLNNLSDTISHMIETKNQNGLNLKEKSLDLFNSIEVLDTNAKSGKLIIEDTIDNINKVLGSLQNQAKNANSMQTYSTSVTTSATIGSKLANNTTKAIEEINTTVNKINSSIDIIDNIVLQTNILSLNASVEASTAGEAGKGFAVVANEVRTLAGKSQDAAKTIRNIVNQAQAKADEGKIIIDKMTQGYEKLQLDIIETVNLIQESIELTNAQEESLNNISKFAISLQEHAEENTMAIENTVNIAQKTNSMARELVESKG